MQELDPISRRAIGAKIRREVLGDTYVKVGDAPPTLFDEMFLEFTEDFCWGNVWNREQLSRPLRSMLNLAMLAVMGRWHEFEVHALGAINNGVSDAEIAEVLLQAGVYAGVPIAAEGLRRAKDVIAKYRPANQSGATTNSHLPVGV